MSEAKGDVREAAEQLSAWLEERAVAFGEWTRATGRDGVWNFSEASLEDLEGLLRERYADDAAILADKTSSFVQGATWYLGEVLRRHRGAVWGFAPWAPGKDAPVPSLFEGIGAVTDTPHLTSPGQNGESGRFYPLGALNVLFWETDELDQPIDSHLRDALDEFV